MKFEYLRPNSIHEVLALLAEHNGETKIIAGGTDLIIKMRKQQLSPRYVINLGHVPGLDDVSYDVAGSLTIGAMTTIRTLEKSTEIARRHPIIAQAAGQLASMAIRNVATVGGNLCNASPSADMVPALICLSATAAISGPDGERTVRVEDFITGPGATVLRRGELLTGINVPAVPSNTGAVYLKHSIRGTTDLAVIGVGAVIRLEPQSAVCQDAAVVLGAVAPTPLRASKAAGVIKGTVITTAGIKKAGKAASAECQPISDVRASVSYRREMVKVFTRQAIREAAALAGNPVEAA